MNNKELYNKLTESFMKFTIAGTGITILTNEAYLQISPFWHYFIVFLSTYFTTNGLYILKQPYSSKYKRETIRDITKLYSEFLKEYSKLNETFSLENPVEINAMFHYLLFNGYLSVNKNFIFYNDTKIDKYHFDNLNSACNIFTGFGVCRHISPMLVDILNYQKIEAHQLIVHCKDYEVNTTFLEKSIHTEEEIKNWIDTRLNKDKKTQEKWLLFIEKLEKEKKEKLHLELIPINNGILSTILGNHVICVAKQNNTVYYLDPTHNMTYQILNGKLMDYEFEIPIKRISTLIESNKLNNFTGLLKLLKSESNISKDEEKKYLEHVKKLYQENRDIFETFYTNNKELYNDISDKVLKLSNKNQFTK